MIDCLRALGAGIVVAGECGERLTVDGVAGEYSTPAEPLFVGNSGTTIRFLTAAAPLAPHGASVVLDGIARMRERPIQDLIDAMTQLGSDAVSVDGTRCPPVRVGGGGLRGGNCRVRGTLSSQYLSALLMAAPLAVRDTVIDVEGDLVSKPYVDLTAAVMKSFGATCSNEAYRRLVVPGQQKYNGIAYEIEPDASNATYFLAAAALTGGRVRLNGLGSASLQGDAAFVDVLSAMGCSVEQGANATTVSGPATLRAVEYDMEAIPDTAQTAAALALFADGTTRLTGLRTLRVKETDRIAAMATELRKLGAVVVDDDESLTITPPPMPTAAAIDTYDDHRMAMSFAVAGLRVRGLVINDPGCVAKTFPDFWERWDAAFGVVVA
jgi:3-phosphoshikimate 1-carboxyvinyltransferase